MVCGDVTLGLGVIFKHGEVHHPQWTPALCKETIFTAKLALAQLDTQRTHRIVNDLGLVRTKENQITILRTGALDELGQCLRSEERRVGKETATGRAPIPRKGATKDTH